MARRSNEFGPGIARRLRSKRRAAGLTPRQLADLYHCALQTVQRLEDGGARNVGIGTIADLARALRVPPGWLAYGAKTK